MASSHCFGAQILRMTIKIVRDIISETFRENYLIQMCILLNKTCKMNALLLMKICCLHKDRMDSNKCGKVSKKHANGYILWSGSSQIDLTVPIPLQIKPQPTSSNLKICYSHGTLYPSCWLQSRKLSSEWYSVLTALTAYTDMGPSLLRWPKFIHRFCF